MSAVPVTLITGASGGIGAELARIFARHGHALALVARSGDKLEALADEIAVAGGQRPLVIAADLTEAGAVRHIDASLEAAGMVPDILVNNAGFGLAGEIADLDAAEQIAMIDLNVRALVELTLRFMPSIRARRGKILNVASVVAFFPGPGIAVYYASKAFVRSFTLALWQEMRPQGVTVTLLCPGATATGFQARAGIGRNSGLSQVPGTGARDVAEAAYAGLMAGRRTVVPGVFNKLATWIMPVLPDAVALPIIWRLQKTRR